MNLTPGAAFGAYDLVAELGRGGMGAVFRARERASGREVAVKVLLDSSAARPEDRERFRREGEVAAGLVHPGIVRVHAAGEVGGLMFLACELVEDARDLATAARALPPLARARLVRDAARALGHAHARGVVHRDVKPDNLLVDAAGRVRVADFGVAGGRALERLTRTGAIVGTPRYMAPEQIDADRDRIGPPADVWALGVVLHEVLAGARPFEADSLANLYGKIVGQPPPDLRVVAPDAPRAMADVVERALAKRPDARYPHADALADDLDLALDGRATLAGAAASRRRRRRAAAAVAGLLAVGGAVALVARGPGPPPAPAEPPPPAPARPAPTLDLGPVDAGWTLLAADEEVWRVDARTEGGRVDLRVDGRPVESARLPVDVPVPPGGWRHVHVELFGPDGDLVAREEVGVLRLPAHLAREGPRAARAADGSLLLLVPPPAARSYARPDLRVGNNNEYFDKLSRLSLDLARGPKPLAHPYLLGRCEVSAGQFRARFPDHEAARGAPPDHPVAWVTREDADDYARAFGLALPTLVEWMWAARGGDERPWPWGHGAPADLPANFGAAALPVDSLPEGAGRWGHLHLAGNVHEWVAVEADEGDGLLARCLAMGGSWTQGRRRPTSATDLRLDVRPGSRHDAVGFRLAWRPDP